MFQKYRLLPWSSFVFILLFLSCGAEIKLNEFPIEDYTSVVAYQMSGEYGEVVESGRLSKKITGKSEVLKPNQIQTLLNIFKDKSTYGDVAANCFEPHIGYVFYNQKKAIIANATVCFACNQIRTSPEIGAFILSARGVTRLADLEQEIYVE